MDAAAVDGAAAASLVAQTSAFGVAPTGEFGNVWLIFRSRAEHIYLERHSLTVSSNW